MQIIRLICITPKVPFLHVNSLRKQHQLHTLFLLKKIEDSNFTVHQVVRKLVVWLLIQRIEEETQDMPLENTEHFNASIISLRTKDVLNEKV